MVDCMIALPSQLFYSTQIPACLWFLARNKNPGNGWRDRRGEVLFIDARKLGHGRSDAQGVLRRGHRPFSWTYHAWRGEPGADVYEDEPGFCKAATLEEVRGHNHVLTPGRYVGAAAADADDVPFEERFAELKETLAEQFAERLRS